MKLPWTNFFSFCPASFCSFCWLTEEQSYTFFKKNHTTYYLGFRGHGVYGSAGCWGSAGAAEPSCSPCSISRAVCLWASDAVNKYAAVFCRPFLGKYHFTASHRALGGWYTPRPHNSIYYPSVNNTRVIYKRYTIFPEACEIQSAVTALFSNNWANKERKGWVRLQRWYTRDT